jgi:hypothetical protein
MALVIFCLFTQPWPSNGCFSGSDILAVRPHVTIQGVSKRALQLLKSIQIFTEDIQNVLNCQNVAKHCKFDARNSARPFLPH